MPVFLIAETDLTKLIESGAQVCRTLNQTRLGEMTWTNGVGVPRFKVPAVRPWRYAFLIRCRSGISGHAVLASTPHASRDGGHRPCVRGGWLADASESHPIGSRSRSIHKRGGACASPTSDQLILVQPCCLPHNHATLRMAGPRPKFHGQRDIPRVAPGIQLLCASGISLDQSASIVSVLSPERGIASALCHSTSSTR